MGRARITFSIVLLAGLSHLLAHPVITVSAQQTGTQPQTRASHLVGSLTAIHGKSLIVKPDTGAPVTVTVSDTAHILRSAPGAKSVAGATPIQLNDLAVGDRVLIAIHPAPDGSASMATTVIAMKQADIEQKHRADQADWQSRGVGGLVKAVDVTAGTVTIAAEARTLTIRVSPKTTIRRYDRESIQFSDAKLSTLDQIHPGDQLRARGDRSADGSEIDADEIVVGSFRNIAGTVISADLAAHTVTVADLATKKPVVIQISADSQLHRLPAMIAQGLAARFRNGRPGHAAGTPQGSPAAAQSRNVQPEPHPDSGGGRRNGDLSQILERAPVIQLSDLHKGDVVMIIATQGTPDRATAFTLLTGVEPILSASPSASRDMFSSWNLGGTGGGGASAAPEGGP